jgi:hypothetical protein
MTLIVTINHPKAIVMSADSRRTEEGFTCVGTDEPVPYRTFSTIRKIYPIESAGCFSYWGDITRLEVELPKLHHQLDSRPFKNVIELKDWVYYFLHDIVSPDQYDHGPIGFHIGGYDSQGNPQIYHIFWGWQADVTDFENTHASYHINDHSKDFIVFNGVPDYARSIYLFLAELEYQVRIKGIGDYGPVVAARFCDYLVRFTSRYDETVGADIVSDIILPSNKQFIAINATKYPLEAGSLSFYLNQLEQSEHQMMGRIYNGVRLVDPLSNNSSYSPVAIVGKA